MRKTATCLGVVLSLLSMLSCSNDNFPKYVALGGLRILAIVASDNTAPNAGKAEGSPGDVFTLTPYLSDVNSAGVLNYTAFGCVDPGVSNGAEATCANDPAAVNLGSGTVTGLSTANVYTGATAGISVSIPSTILSGRSNIDSYNGVNYLVTYAVTNSLGQTVKSFKRIPISDPTTGKSKNSNPGISRILANGATLTTLSGGAVVDLSTEFTAGSNETYSYMTTSGGQSSNTETLQSTWFYTDGEVKYYRTTSTDSTTYTAPDSFPTSRGALIVTVLRDGRGGEAVQVNQVH
jgi:hypothetical protein